MERDPCRIRTEIVIRTLMEAIADLAKGKKTLVYQCYLILLRLWELCKSVVPKMWVRTHQWVSSQFQVGCEAIRAAVLKI